MDTLRQCGSIQVRAMDESLALQQRDMVSADAVFWSCGHDENSLKYWNAMSMMKYGHLYHISAT